MSQNVALSASLTPRQQKAIAALAAGETQERAAAAAGVSRRTVLRWSDDPRFAGAVRATRAAAFERTLAGIEQGAAEAVVVLRSLAKVSAKDARTLGGAARLRADAAKALVAVGLRAHESLAVEERLSAIEAKLREGGA